MIESNLKQVMVDDALVTPEMVKRYHDLLMREGNRQATLARMRAGPDAPGAYQQIPTITAPTLVIWGEADPWIPFADAKRFTQEIKGSRLVAYPNIGHLPQEEVALATSKEVEAFLQQVYPKPLP
jgi:pimeloyl-ACP methyl ester carboxylesterase